MSLFELPLFAKALIALAGVNVAVLEIGPELSREINSILNTVTVILIILYGERAKKAAEIVSDIASPVPGGRRAMDPPSKN